MAIQNGFIARFNGSFRDELLNEVLLTLLPQARDRITVWKQDDNSQRPHSSLGRPATVRRPPKMRGVDHDPLRPGRFAVEPGKDAINHTQTARADEACTHFARRRSTLPLTPRR